MIHLRPFALNLSKGWFHGVEWFDKLTTNGLMDYLGLMFGNVEILGFA